MLNIHFELEISDDPVAWNQVRHPGTPWLSKGCKYWLKSTKATVILGTDRLPVVEHTITQFSGGVGHMLRSLCLIPILLEKEQGSREIKIGGTNESIKYHRDLKTPDPSHAEATGYIANIFPIVWKSSNGSYSLREKETYSRLNIVNILFTPKKVSTILVHSGLSHDYNVNVDVFLNGKELRVAELEILFNYLTDKYEENPIAEDDFVIGRDPLIWNRVPAYFVGRLWVFQAIDDFIAKSQCSVSSPRSGYFCIMGPPGIGKSAICKHIARERTPGRILPYVYFRLGRTNPEEFLMWLYREIQSEYRSVSLPPPNDISLNSEYLNLLLKTVANSVDADSTIVIVIDALDEAPHGVLNFLPTQLPDGVYIITSFRGSVEEECPLIAITNELMIQVIRDDDSRNRADIDCYINSFSTEPSIIQHSKDKNIAISKILNDVKTRSGGNFLYAYYTLYNIRIHNSTNNLPTSLEEYYRCHIKRLHKISGGGDKWNHSWLPILIILANVQGSLPRQLIQILMPPAPLGLIDIIEITNILSSMNQLLTEERIKTADGKEYLGYRIYHADFIRHLQQRSDFFTEDDRVDFIIAEMGKHFVNHFINVGTTICCSANEVKIDTFVQRMLPVFIVNNLFSSRLIKAQAEYLHKIGKNFEFIIGLRNTRADYDEFDELFIGSPYRTYIALNRYWKNQPGGQQVWDQFIEAFNSTYDEFSFEIYSFDMFIWEESEKYLIKSEMPLEKIGAG